jgi:hypothetical protein
MFTGTLPLTSTSEDWIATFECVDDTTNLAFDLTGASINIAVRGPQRQSPDLTGSLVDGHITLVGAATDGTFTVHFTRVEMSVLAPNEYDVGITVTAADGTTEQALAGELPVRDGIVRL